MTPRCAREARSQRPHYSSSAIGRAQSGALVDALLAWRPRARTLPGAFEEMYIHMYELGIVGLRDVELAQSWLSDLTRIGYTFPALGRGVAHTAG